VDDGRRPTPRIHPPPLESTPPELARGTAPIAVEGTSPAELDAETVSLDGELPKPKRARRGTRGGRKRKKPSTNGDQGGELAEAGEPEPVVAERSEPAGVSRGKRDTGPDQAQPEKYVPMSEWIEDFESGSRRAR
jgi:hypothetical protein